MITVLCTNAEKEQIILTLDGSVECPFLYSDVKCVSGEKCGDCARKNIEWGCTNDQT